MKVSPPLFLLFMSQRFHSRPYVLLDGCLQSLSLSHTDTHINILIFMSLCSHCVHMLSLVLCCCSAAHKLAFSQRPGNNTKAVSTPSRPACPQSITHPSYTHTYNTMTPQLQSYCCWGPLNGPCVTLGPLCLIRCYNQTTKGLWHRDLLSILHTLTEQDKWACMCVSAEGCYAGKKRGQ